MDKNKDWYTKQLMQDIIWKDNAMIAARMVDEYVREACFYVEYLEAEGEINIDSSKSCRFYRSI